MKQPQTINVDGEIYTIQPYLTTHGMKLLTDIFMTVGAPAVKIAFDVKDDVEGFLEKDTSSDDAIKAITQLTANINADKIDSLFRRILEGTLLPNSSTPVTTVYDTHFMGRYSHLFKVVWKTLEAQYGDFLGAISALGGVRKIGKQA